MKWLRDNSIRFLIWLLDRREEEKDEDVDLIQKWLSESWNHPGAVAYRKQREKILKDAIAGGVGLKPFPQEEYRQYLGQRFELHRLANRCQQAYKKENK